MAVRFVRILLPLVVLVLVPRVMAERVFTVDGVVRSRFKEGHIVVTHQDIVGYMPAMTMPFAVAPAARETAARLQVGDKVEFSLHVTEDDALAEGFKVKGASSGAVSPSAALPAVQRVQEGDPVPEFALVDEEGHPLTRATLSGHVTVLTFIFTRCPVPEYCPLMARRFGELQKAIAVDPGMNGRAQLLSITLDPEFDRPEVLRAYGQAVGANPAIWHFGTGETEKVTSLVRAFSVYTERNGALLDHTLCTALIDREGKIVQLWRGNGWKAEEIVAAMKAAG
jgi:protein SCO1/2